MRDVTETSVPKRARAFAVAGLASVIALTGMAGAADAKPKKAKAVPVKVMTRNIFLGADLGPALNATGFESFIEANGGILREVTQTDFPRRAVGLAGEIAAKKPDLIGLQEAAMWRTGPTALPPTISNPPGPFTATTVRYDFVQNLVDELAARGMDYEVAVSTTEFDFEAPADENNVDNDAPPGQFNSDPATDDEGPNSLDDAELNGRLTMRDVILVNKDSKVKAKLKNPQSGNFNNVFTPTVSGLPIEVTRGYAAGDVTVQKGKGKDVVKKKFRFVNTHFEAFDDETQRPSIRALQAQELLAGPAKGKKPVIILGDFNSNVPPVQPGDEQAFQTLLDGGFRSVSLTQPITCCVSNVFTSPPSEFDHQVDHIMTNQPKSKVKLVNSSATGREQVNGIYNSDHAGVFSTLKLK